MSFEQTMHVVQVAFPQVYLACHTRHQRKRSTAYRLSARDATILAHLHAQEAATPARLASHLGVARSTLSEALKHLTTLEYTRQTERTGAAGRRGGVGVLLTSKGAAAIRETSVLEPHRLKTLLQCLTPAELRAVERGMGALGAACARCAPQNRASAAGA